MSFFFSSPTKQQHLLAGTQEHQEQHHDPSVEDTLATRLLNEDHNDEAVEEVEGAKEESEEANVAEEGEEEVQTEETLTPDSGEEDDGQALLEDNNSNDNTDAALEESWRNPQAMFSLFVSACGYLAPWLSVMVFLAPLPTIRQIQRDQSVGSLPLLPYTSMIANCFVWLNYGIAKREAKVWASNGVGLILALYYTAIYRQYAASTTTTLHFRVVSSLCFVTLVMFLLQWGEWIGRLGVVICVILFASPLSALGVVISTKSAKSIPLPFTMACIANCGAWSVTGIWQMKGDFNIFGPNVLGLLLGLVQLALKLYFGNGSGGIAKDDLGLSQELIPSGQQTTAV